MPNVFEPTASAQCLSNKHKQVFEPVTPTSNNFSPTSKEAGVYAGSPSVGNRGIFESAELGNRGYSVFEQASVTVTVQSVRVDDSRSVVSEYQGNLNQAVALQECERIRCAVCGNIVDAIVLERTPMLVKYKCTHSGCGALFSAKGSVAKVAGVATTAISLINLGIGAVKLSGGDISGLDDIFRHHDVET